MVGFFFFHTVGTFKTHAYSSVQKMNLHRCRRLGGQCGQCTYCVTAVESSLAIGHCLQHIILTGYKGLV